MMVIQAQSSPVVGENLTRVNKEPSKANVAQEPKTKQPKVDEKEKTNGLRVPGSNWEKYKILLAESKAIKKEPVESTSVTSPRKRHRPRKRPGPNKQTNLSDDSQVHIFYFEHAKSTQINNNNRQVFASNTRVSSDLGNMKFSLNSSPEP